MKPRAFVVMPFGSKPVRAAVPAAEGRPAEAAVSVDFTELYRRLLKPALERAGCEPFRADEESAAGDIRTDMFFELVTADLVIADISILNPNVFYELGLRHGVSPRGVVHIHGGWERQPFDVAPDRTFKYDGAMWSLAAARDAAWEERVEREVASLGATLQAAIAQDRTTTSSPVYSHLPGLQPVDWRGISTARARYFHGVLDDWRERLRVARMKGWAGDILTLAGDAPTRYHREQLLLAAAKALIELCRFAAARGVLEELVVQAPEHVEGQCQLGLVLNRLGEAAKAEVLLIRVVEAQQGNPEAQGILGRVYKDRWRARWEAETDPAARQLAAVRSSSLAAAAARSYAAAQRRPLGDYYTGINVVSLARLLEHLGRVTGESPAETGVRDLGDLVGVVRWAASNDLERTVGGTDQRSQETAVWARATLGELALVEGDAATAYSHYRDAVESPGATGFAVASMLSQIELLARLGFAPEAVGPIAARLAERAAKPAAAYGKVVVVSGHMIDEPGRAAPRFPPEKEGAVREAIAARLERWQVGPGDLALSGGARGADLVFAELCLARGAQVRLLVALEEPEFLRRSVRLPSGDWEDRYYDAKERSEVWYEPERLGRPAPGQNPFERNNLWILDTARVEAPPPPKPPVHAVLVWDEQPTGDGPGGTFHFAEQVERLGGRVAIVNPTRL